MASTATPLGSSADGVSQRRRLLRKGTRSCIECKRRKIRCFFLSSGDSKCVSCQRRGTTCLGQEFSAESAGFSRPEDEVSRRLDRFEALLARVMDRTARDRSGPVNSDSSRERALNESSSSVHSASDQSPQYLSSDGNASAMEDGASSSQGSPGASQRSDRQDKISQTLFAALPSQQDAIAIIDETDAYGFLHIVCNPLASILAPDFDQQASILSALPSVSDHPTVIARALLRLALAIQQQPPSRIGDNLQMREKPQKAMARYVSLAHSLVTSDDRVVDTLEGYECLLLECVYIINTGNLRQGMVRLRRSLTLAQMAGLDGINTARKVPAAMDPNTTVSLNRAWDRIVYAERYVSLLLGMPSAIPMRDYDMDTLEKDRFGGPIAPSDRLDVFHAAIAGRINARSRTKMTVEEELGVTKDIAVEFQKIEQSFPADWWIQPDLAGVAEAAPKMMMTVLITAQAQITHFNMLTVLHLPYLLSDVSIEALVVTCRTACVASARQVLDRYAALRDYVRIVSCCRFVDFCAFTAVTTLLLAHLLNHQVPADFRGDFERGLAAQRLGDRALVERTMATMEQLNLIRHDPVSSETAKLARSLLAVESDAAAGRATYSAQVVSEHSSGSLGGGGGVDVQVPYFGKVNVAKEESSTAALQQSDMMLPAGQNAPLILGSSSSSSYPAGHQEMASLTGWIYAPEFAAGQPPLHTTVESVEGWAFQGVDDMFFDTLLRPGAAEDASG